MENMLKDIKESEEFVNSNKLNYPICFNIKVLTSGKWPD
jgi:hypothetical protein